MSIDTLRAAVRPTVTWALVGAFIAAAFVDREVAGLIGGPMGIVIGFWFSDRKAGNGGR